MSYEIVNVCRSGRRVVVTVHELCRLLFFFPVTREVFYELRNDAGTITVKREGSLPPYHNPVSRSHLVDEVSRVLHKL